MADNSKSAAVRTTSDGAGQPLGIVTSTGATPDQAVAGLGKRGWAAGHEILNPAIRPGFPPPSTDLEPGDFEVVGVRLAAAGPGAWCAFGTLCQVTGRSYYDQPGR